MVNYTSQVDTYNIVSFPEHSVTKGTYVFCPKNCKFQKILPSDRKLKPNHTVYSNQTQSINNNKHAHNSKNYILLMTQLLLLDQLSPSNQLFYNCRKVYHFHYFNSAHNGHSHTVPCQNRRLCLYLVSKWRCVYLLKVDFYIKFLTERFNVGSFGTEEQTQEV